MHWHNKTQRDKILERNPNMSGQYKSRVNYFVDLCIYPYKFTVLYAQVREGTKLTNTAFAALKGVIKAILVMTNRDYTNNLRTIDDYVIDFISYIKTDKKNDPVKFLLSFKAYIYRYLMVKGMQIAFSIDYRKFIRSALPHYAIIKSNSMHGTLTNLKVRTLLFAYIIFKEQRDETDEDFKPGVNDVVSLINKYSSYKTCLPKEDLIALFEELTKQLPSWNTETRRKTAWFIDHGQDGFYVMNKRYNEYRG